MSKPESGLRRDIERYNKLRRHADADFCVSVQRFESWRAAQMQQCYQSMMANRKVAKVLNYYFVEIFGGIDLAEFQGADRTISVAEKLFTGTDMLNSALEFNALSGEIGDTLTMTLFEEMGVTEIDEVAFVEACHRGDVIDKLYRQMQCFEIFADDLNTTVADRKIGYAIKIARIPAKVGGFPNIYRLVAEGFKAMSGVKNPEALAATIVRHETSAIDRIAGRAQSIFRPLES